MKALVVAIGVLIPYLARVPGELAGRPGWLWQYLSSVQPVGGAEMGWGTGRD